MTQPERDEPVDEDRGHVLDVDSIFGVSVVRDSDPDAQALRLVDESGGEIVRDLEHARSAFAARAEAGRAEPVVLKEAERAELEARADASEVADPAVTEASILELQQLADELAMTQRIRSDTEAGMTESLSRRLSAASAVAIHPATIRHAAAAVTETETEVAACDEDIAALGGRPAADGTRDEADTQPEHRNRRGIVLAVGVGVLFAVGALLLVLAGVFVVVPIAVLTVGAVLAFLFARRGEPAAGNSAAPSPDSPQPSIPDISEEEWVARRAQVDAARQRAIERLRSARRHWESLVGRDADPHHVDDVLRVRDPQLELVGTASRESPTVRTVSAVYRRTRARWRVAWAAVGYDEPPELDSVDTHLERLRASGAEAAEAARERLRSAEAWSDACATIDRPIVLVEPESWLPAETLEVMVNSLPAGAEVIVVEPDASAPE